MSVKINIEEFVSEHITHRKDSIFQVDIDNNHSVLVEEIQDKSVLVIGGAGTIGSSFIKSILSFHPNRVYVIDINENGLTELTRDLRSSYNIRMPNDFKTYPINFHDDIFYKILKKEGPFEIIANFAAHKHVRSEKDEYSIAALIENNILRAEQLIKYLAENAPNHFFCVSTDKAANPVNIMGASKSIMEQVIMAYSDKIKITTARFANVAFSNGSLLDGFLQRLSKNQPLSAPNDVKRYFVSPKESGDICLLACILGNSGDIFFPKLDKVEMLTFSEISNRLLGYLNLKPIVCITEEEARQKAFENGSNRNGYPVYYFNSDTSGEKPFEEFYMANETIDLDSFNSLGIIKNTTKINDELLNKIVCSITNTLNEPSLNKEKIVKLLTEILPSFSHKETGKNLDQKM